jgi:hypothetical protein
VQHVFYYIINTLRNVKVLEKWWRNTTTEWAQNNRNITVVCPHPGLVLNDPILLDTKGHLNGMHTITIDLEQSTAENQQKKKKEEKNLNESYSRTKLRYPVSLLSFYKTVWFFNIRCEYSRKWQQMFRNFTFWYKRQQ